MNNNNDPLLGHQLGSYQLVETLGRGSFAQVYRGRHIYLGTFVAIKVLHGQLEEQERQDFQKEATLLTRLNHPHIIHFMDYGFISGRPYLITDLAEKGSLNRMYPRGTRLPMPLITEYVAQIAQGLDFAHANNVIHRDIKPENILVSNTGELLLADFGIAKSLGTSQSYLTNRVAGTFSYIAPEQFDGHPVPASDQYALGIMVYEWITGRFPFEGTTLELIKHHLQDAPPLLRHFNPTVNTDVESVVLMTLKKEPNQRFRNVGAFANALRQAAGNSPQPQLPRPANLPSFRVTAPIPVPPGRSQHPSNPANTSGQPIVTPFANASSPQANNPVRPITNPSRSQHPFDSEEWQKLLSAQTLPFTALPSLPQAQLTDFWWPTFIISPEDRRKINQGTILSEMLSELGPLTSFPSLSVALPVSSAAKPVTIGTLNSVQSLSQPGSGAPSLTPPPTPILRPTNPGVGRTAGAIPIQPQPTSSQTGSTTRTAPPATAGGQQASATSSSLPQNMLVIVILALFIGIICMLGGGSGHSPAAVISGWILVGIGTVACIVGLKNVNPQQGVLKGWFIFFLILTLTLLLINCFVYSSVYTWCSYYHC